MAHEDIRRAVEGIDFLSHEQYRIGNTVRDVNNVRPIDLHRIPGKHGSVANAQSLSGKGRVDSALSELLATDICKLLCHKAAADTSFEEAALEHDDSFPAMLSGANCGTGTWDHGWHIVSSDIKNNQIAVKKGGVVYRVETHEVKCCGKLDSTMSCCVRIPKEARNLDADFFMIFGNLSHVGGAEPAADVVSFYWNLNAAGAVDYVQLCTEVLNQERLHFKARVLSDPRAYQRSDAGVLSINRVDLEETLPLVRDIHRKLPGKLKPATPLFSKRLADGLGFAEEPKGETSFGFSRAKLIADTLITCLMEERREKDAILQSVRQSFEREGIDPLLPYASKKHITDYEQLFARATNISKQHKKELT